VVAPRALAAGIPFTPEKNGTTFLGGIFGSSDGMPSGSVATTTTPRPASAAANNDWQSGLRLLIERVSNHLAQR
jgi:hypothetical protein